MAYKVPARRSVLSRTIAAMILTTIYCFSLLGATALVAGASSSSAFAQRGNSRGNNQRGSKSRGTKSRRANPRGGWRDPRGGWKPPHVKRHRGDPYRDNRYRRYR